MSMPRDFEKWNPAMRGALIKGMKARESGIDRGSCPYIDKRKDCGRLTWARAFILSWQDGWDCACPINQNYTDRNRSGLAALSK